MHLKVRTGLRLLAGCGLLAASTISGYAQGTVSTLEPVAVLLPDAPSADSEMALSEQPAAAVQDGQPGTATPAATQQPSSGSQSSSSGSQASGASSQTTPETQHQQAQRQLKTEEKQRMLGVVPIFNVTYTWNAAPLSAGQKMDLAFHSATDPFTFVAASLVAGLHEAFDQDQGFGWGAAGYGKRTGAAYLDAFDGAMIGNGILPAVFHQDPRYFRLGHGTFTHRFLYSIATSYICRGDNGHWQPNYSNVGGNIIAGAISNYYYPAQSSGWGQAITNGFIVTTEGTVGGVLDEFWPDISRKFLHKNPTHGADAQTTQDDKAQPQSEPATGK